MKLMFLTCGNYEQTFTPGLPNACLLCRSGRLESVSKLRGMRVREGLTKRAFSVVIMSSEISVNAPPLRLFFFQAVFSLDFFLEVLFSRSTFIELIRSSNLLAMRSATDDDDDSVWLRDP